MKKILSIVLIFAVCLSLIATPVFAQITYENKQPAQPEEPAGAEDSVDFDMPVSEAEIANARMTFNLVANYIAEFDAAQLYADLSEIVNFSDSFDFWKDDMTADLKNLIFGELKASLPTLDSSTFLEDAVRESLSSEEGKSSLASAGIKQIGDNAFDLMGFMTMTVEGNAYIYSDATGKVIQKLSLAAGPDPDSVYINFETNADPDQPLVIEAIAHIGDDKITVSGKEDGATEFEPQFEIDFSEKNLVSIIGLKDEKKMTVQFIPENYQISITTPGPNDEIGEPVEEQVSVVEINPENKSLGLTVNGEELLTVYFYPEEKEITLVSPGLADATAGLGGSGGESLTFKFDDETMSLDVVSGESPLAELVFSQENSAIDLSISAGEMGMMSGISLRVDAAANNVVFVFMGMEMFNLTLDTEAETISIASVDMETQSKTTEVLTLEDLAKMLRNQVGVEAGIVE